MEQIRDEKGEKSDNYSDEDIDPPYYGQNIYATAEVKVGDSGLKDFLDSIVRTYVIKSCRVMFTCGGGRRGVR